MSIRSEAIVVVISGRVMMSISSVTSISWYVVVSSGGLYAKNFLVVGVSPKMVTF
jgi:hypothetical protein